MEKIIELVNFFEKNVKSIKSNWNETETRIELINPLFEQLGWDVNNQQKLADPFKEVKHEASLKIGSNMKAPDYSFNYGKRLFFLEAKKPSVDIKTDISPSYQLRRYGWTAKLPISILTDFEELAIYDCSIKPNKNDNAGVARLKYYTYRDYIDKWDEIKNFISKDAILRGSLNEFESKQIKGTATIDDDFLVSIEAWRKSLAQNIALRNKNLNEKELNFSIQMIIDRIIFLRICEDRGIEKYETLKNIVNNVDCYSQLIEIFKIADEKYNSGLFHFKTEKSRNENPDNITPDLSIDDKVLKDILKGLYYPDCPYELSVISSDVLGNVYERFLGKVITLNEKSHRANVELKPELKKAGGVFYTPPYVVDYIVKNTIGELLLDKTPNQINDFKILDPACGSGSFLIEAYQFLLDWHLNYYQNNDTNKWKQGKEPRIFDSTYGTQLTLNERKRILKNNIFGIDIDKNAVEVTKLSLLLKVLEYEGADNVQKTLFNERILPDLYENIKCGNTLVGNDAYKTKKFDDIIDKINPFNWETEFSSIISKGGFDCIIGNPPYLKEATDKTQFHYVKETNLKEYYQGKMDLWYIFACKALDLLKENGLHSFIATNNWITNDGASILRNKILKESKILKFVDFSDYKVFQTASIQTMIYIVKKCKTPKDYKVKYTKVKNKNISVIELSEQMSKYFSTARMPNKADFIWFDSQINPNELINKTITFNDSQIVDILNKIINSSNYRLPQESIGNGIDVLQDFVIEKHLEKISDKTVKKGDGIFVLTNKEKESLNFNNNELAFIKPYYTSENIFKYSGLIENKYWIIYADEELRTNINNYPNIKNHLIKFKNIMTSVWKPYGLHRPREQHFFEGEKILSIRKTREPLFSYTNFPCYVSRAFMIIQPNDIDLKYLTGLLNSRLIHFWLYYKGKKQGDQLQIDKSPLLELPLVKSTDVREISEINSIVNQITEVQSKYFKTNTDHEKKQLITRINILSNEIDNIVYKLYGLTDEDIKFIEDSIKTI